MRASQPRPFSHPILRGDLESVQRYIATGGDLERMDWDNCTALHIACAGAFSQVAQLVSLVTCVYSPLLCIRRSPRPSLDEEDRAVCIGARGLCWHQVRSISLQLQQRAAMQCVPGSTLMYKHCIEESQGQGRRDVKEPGNPAMQQSCFHRTLCSPPSIFAYVRYRAHQNRGVENHKRRVSCPTHSA